MTFRRTRALAWLAVVTVTLLVFATVADRPWREAGDVSPYITVEMLSQGRLTFTREEYVARVYGQLDRYGYYSLCVDHLLTVRPPMNENNQRKYDVIAGVCDETREARDG